MQNTIDQTLLKPTATIEDFKTFFKTCNEYQFYGACFPSALLPLSKELLLPQVKRVTVIGFPHGNQHTQSKLKECDTALELGADEVDMVISLGFFLSQKFQDVEKEIKDLVQLVKSYSEQKLLKVIVESSLLSKEQVLEVTKLVGQTGADYIKTSTGFAGGGATLEAVSWMKSVAPAHLKIKASGGIKNRKSAQEFLDAGASRLGTSSGVEICTDCAQNLDTSSY